MFNLYPGNLNGKLLLPNKLTETTYFKLQIDRQIAVI